MSIHLEKYSKWLRLYARLNKRSVLDPQSNRYRSEVLGRLLIRLVKTGVLNEDAPIIEDFDEVPFGILGTMSLNRLDLGSLIKAWKLNGLRELCPKCELQSLLVFSICGSPFSGAGGWTGVCEKCHGIHSFAPEIGKCYWCKCVHPSAAWTIEMLKLKEDGSWTGFSTLGIWIHELGRYGEIIGQSLWIRKICPPRYVRRGFKGGRS